MTKPRATTLFAAMLLSAAGCGAPAAAPAPAPTPAPLPVPVIAAPTVARYRVPLTLALAAYNVRMRTELERDSAGRRDKDVLESSARVELTLRRDARGSLRGAGRVDSFVVRASGASVRSSAPTGTVTTIAAPLFTSVAIDAVLDSLTLRTIVRPPLANECDRPEAAAAGVARDVLVRVPEITSIGDRWRDSLVTLVCRGGVPMTMRTTIETTVAGVTDGGKTLQLRRAIQSSIEGISKTPWRQTTITGDGSGTQTALVDIARGTLTALDGEATLTVRIVNGSLRDAAHTEQVVQRVTVTVRPVQP